ncbi:hypothetical protein JMA_08200 [Jeotgalibacillus malaysiensis]|uniref:DUF5673 domain-containing protein n=1 Tax=Jeotgalibacillus malaysiensis TaxID=1508404 RepID=A0A0B5ANA0_9BACL|nr:hypothetical protein [Jeotgalibacillus malaysiensis]AJD90137.1 hypothetical protein JMA_08200 [Jeotgalibacillus malaysiensis]
MNREFHEGNMVWIVFSIITFLSSILFAFIGPNLLHYLFFSYGDIILIQTPIISNVLFAIFGLLLSLFFFMMYKEGKTYKATGFGALILSVLILVISVTNYSVLREEKIIHNGLLSVTSTEYQWSDIESAVMIRANDDVEHETFIFNMSNGENLEFIRNEHMISAFPKIDGMLQVNGVRYTSEERE